MLYIHPPCWRGVGREGGEKLDLKGTKSFHASQTTCKEGNARRKIDLEANLHKLDQSASLLRVLCTSWLESQSCLSTFHRRGGWWEPQQSIKASQVSYYTNNSTGPLVTDFPGWLNYSNKDGFPKYYIRVFAWKVKQYTLVCLLQKHKCFCSTLRQTHTQGTSLQNETGFLHPSHITQSMRQFISACA